MKIICLGDSLTEGDYGVLGKRGIANVKEKNYPYFLSGLANAEVINYGICGTDATYYLEHFEREGLDVSSADIIIIMLGTNGGLSTKEATRGNADYEKIVLKCQAEAPKAKIVLCTPPHATENEIYSNCGYLPQVKSSVEFVREFALSKKLPLIDVFAFDGFNAETESVMQPNDGLHFGEKGYETLAEVIFEGLKKLFPEI